jgi:hypothetical protein
MLLVASQRQLQQRWMLDRQLRSLHVKPGSLTQVHQLQLLQAV